MLSACIILFHGNNKILNINHESVNSQQMSLYRCYAVKTDINIDSYRVYLIHLNGLIRVSFLFLCIVTSTNMKVGYLFAMCRIRTSVKACFHISALFLVQMYVFSDTLAIKKIFLLQKDQFLKLSGGVLVTNCVITQTSYSCGK